MKRIKSFSFLFLFPFVVWCQTLTVPNATADEQAYQSLVAKYGERNTEVKNFKALSRYKVNNYARNLYTWNFSGLNFNAKQLAVASAPRFLMEQQELTIKQNQYAKTINVVDNVLMILFSSRAGIGSRDASETIRDKRYIEHAYSRD